jgi:hypothetical protein
VQVRTIPLKKNLNAKTTQAQRASPTMIYLVFKFINHVRVQAAHDREHGWSISFTLCRGLHTLPTVRVKAPKNFKPNHAMLAKHHTTLPRCDCIGTLRSLYKGMQKTNDPHSYRSGRTITLPSGQYLSKGYYPKRAGLYPCNPDPPLLLSEKGH